MSSQTWCPLSPGEVIRGVLGSYYVDLVYLTSTSCQKFYCLSGGSKIFEQIQDHPEIILRFNMSHYHDHYSF